MVTENNIKKSAIHKYHTHCNGKSFQTLANDLLKASHFKITKPRLAVIQCLESSKTPLSPKKILEKIKDDIGLKIDLVSVYRVLEALTKLELVHQIHPSGDYLCCSTICETNPHHILVHCVKCRSISEMQWVENVLDSILNQLQAALNFTPTEHLIQINGVCQECRKKG